MPALKRSRNGSRGQALVETALILPVFLALLLGIVDMGRAVWATTSLASAAREAARFAIVHGGNANTACPVGPPGVNAVIPVADSSCPYPSPSKQSIVDAATAAAIAGGSNVTVTVCYGAGCSGNTDVAGATNDRGTSITVAVTSQVNLVVPALLGRSGFNLSGSATMVVNH
ncbi:MAG: pilus assembly protein [Deltaproteobacteria bacterium]|nr:MAG: pilus assembly protein [Deltaproteobacteria bacterium]